MMDDSCRQYAPLQPIETPLLGWYWDPQCIPQHTKIFAIVRLLRDMRLTPMDFLLETISLSSEYDSTRNGFYQGSGLDHFLNTISQNKKGINKLESWIRPRALNLVVDEVQREMDNLKELLTMKIADITPEFLTDFNLDRDITTILEEHSPWMHHILLSVAQTPCAIHENAKKIAGPVSKSTYVTQAIMTSQSVLLGCSHAVSQHEVPEQSSMCDSSGLLLLQLWSTSEDHQYTVSLWT